MTKLFLPVTLIIVLAISQSCRKDEQVCYDYIELKDTNHLVDISILNTVPELRDTLAKYPELKVASIINDDYQIGMICNYFYKGLICFESSYSLYKGKKQTDLYLNDQTPKKINVAIKPTLPYTKAIEIAKQNLDFKNACIAYRLGLSYQDTSATEKPNSYKLVWKIQDTYGNSYAIIDAHNGEIYSKFDGVWE